MSYIIIHCFFILVRNKGRAFKELDLKAKLQKCKLPIYTFMLDDTRVRIHNFDSMQNFNLFSFGALFLLKVNTTLSNQ